MPLIKWNVFQYQDTEMSAKPIPLSLIYLFFVAHHQIVLSINVKGNVFYD